MNPAAITSYLLLFVLLSLSRGAGAVTCFDFTGHAYKDCVDRRLRELKIDLDRPLTLEELTGGPPALFKPPNSHHGGYTHEAIYRSGSHTRQTLIKVIDYSEVFGERPAAFLEQVYGYLLAEDIGGPYVTRAGVLRSPPGAHKKLVFIEMEQLFPQGDAESLKGQSVFYPTNSQLRQISQLFIWAIERNVHVDSDVDFLFRGDEFRWIDSGGWKIENLHHHDFLEALVTLIHRVYRADHSTGGKFQREFVKMLGASKALSTESKEFIENRLNAELQILRKPRSAPKRPFNFIRNCIEWLK